MSQTFEIFWGHLTEEAQNELISNGFQYDDNMDVFPIAILHQEEDLEDFQ